MLNFWEVGITCLLLFAIVYIGMPFSNENAGKLENMYSLLPGKLSSMVLGRFIYLNIMIIIFILICFGTGIGYFARNSFEILTMTDMVVIIIFSIILNLGTYPLYYKAQLEKNNIVKTAMILIISIVMFFMVILIPAEVTIINSVFSKELNSIAIFILSNSKNFIVLDILIFGVVDYMSYLASCRICKRKGV